MIVDRIAPAYLVESGMGHTMDEPPSQVVLRLVKGSIKGATGRILHENLPAKTQIRLMGPAG